MKIERIPVDAVEISRSHRPANPEVVAALAASMRLIGQLQPITVYEAGGTAHLVAGRHRLEAAEFLAWEEIEAVFVTGDEIDRRLREISENLHRAELTVQERSSQIAEWAELIEQKAKVRQVGAPGGDQPNEKGQRKTARELNITEQQVRRAKQIASITPEAKEAARAAGLDDNQSALVAVSKEAPDAQVAKVLQFKELGKVSTKTWRDDFERLWARGTTDDHAWAREAIDQPVMDARFK